MHGRPRVKAGAQDPEKVKAAEKKGQLLGQLCNAVLTRRAARLYDEESLALAARLLELNPEVYTAWNFRREAVEALLAAGGEAAVAAACGELAVTEKALMRNPKSYAAWHHRRWVVGRRLCSLERELALVGRLLEADDRNFHGWGYRRFVVQLMGTPAERELAFAEEKINHNFSNYSAWHHRTTLLPAAHAAELASAPREAAVGLAAAEAEAAAGAAATPGPGEPPAAGGPLHALPPPPWAVLASECELVKQAFFTEPEDQSGWFYHRWLLGCALARWERARGQGVAGEETGEREKLLLFIAREEATCEELLELEPGCKWPLLTLARLRELAARVAQAAKAETAPPPPPPAAAAAAPAAAEGEAYARLRGLDPLRRGYYEDAAAGRAQVLAAEWSAPC